MYDSKQLDNSVFKKINHNPKLQKWISVRIFPLATKEDEKRILSLYTL